ncbi:MAG: ferredoxin [Chloroflexi bacterium]|nr:ferredoxin [Chloroflexota bacterium]
MRIRVDRDKCTGVANCVAIAPTVFELDDENKAVILDETSVDEDTLWRSAKNCPKDAIIVEDDKGKQIYP